MSSTGIVQTTEDERAARVQEFLQLGQRTAKMIIGEIFKLLEAKVEKAAFTQKQFAEYQAILATVPEGEEPTLETVIALCEALGLQISQMIKQAFRF